MIIRPIVIRHNEIRVHELEIFELMIFEKMTFFVVNHHRWLFLLLVADRLGAMPVSIFIGALAVSCRLTYVVYPACLLYTSDAADE